jgi:hypothetical protein
MILIRVIDLAGEPGYPKEDLLGRPTPEHDYRLEADTPTGGSITFSRGATADHVFWYWQREGWPT